MSMSHKAFVLDADRFQAELRATLERALADGDVEPLRRFIAAHRGELTDPYEGAPLDDDWESMIETRDAHQYGDFALTRYYDAGDDLGLGDGWRELGELLEREGVGERAILGTPVGAPGNAFDPGKMGSYFQSPPEVRANLQRVDALAQRRPDLADRLAPARAMLAAAASAARGLYVTF